MLNQYPLEQRYSLSIVIELAERIYVYSHHGAEVNEEAKGKNS
jgi:hypothetical protein